MSRRFTTTGAGPLLTVACMRPPAATRYATPRRLRHSPSAVFERDDSSRFSLVGSLDEPPEYPTRLVPLDYRQSSLGFTPYALRLRRDSLKSTYTVPRAPSPDSHRPQFALVVTAEVTNDDDPATPLTDAAYERVYEEAYGALLKSSPRISAANMAELLSDKAGDKARPRKVLNTERYNNGAAAPLLRRRSRAAPAQRAAIHALLACTTLFYVLAFVTFYFLSLT